jgi:hypothetical protein
MIGLLKTVIFVGSFAVGATTIAFADSQPENPRRQYCDKFLGWRALHQSLASVMGARGHDGLGFNTWATLVENDGAVYAVASFGKDYANQWLAGRVIAAQKANTSNALRFGNGSNLPLGAGAPNALSLSTANLYAAAQPRGSLYGLQFSNPVDYEQAHLKQNGQPDDPATFGTALEPMVGRPIGGVNLFGGGIALLLKSVKVDGFGVSSDASCTDHFVAWKVRNVLGYNQMGYGKANAVGGVYVLVTGGSKRRDNIIVNIKDNQQNTLFKAASARAPADPVVRNALG